MSKELKYRADIDGLRAIAVLAVIVFHINNQWMSSGYLGVDIFFVLSGYLITKIISKEMLRGSFSFIDFYKRRAKRILPVFIFVLLCTTIAAAVFFLPADFKQYLKSTVASLMFAANLFFARRGGYFEVSSAERPLQHIWSLSLEEQFYFVFPVLLLGFYRFRPNSNGRNFIILLISLSLLSAFLPTFGMDAYFLPHVRAYELLIGSLFAFIPSLTKRIPNILNWAMLAVVAAMLFLPGGLLPGGGYIERLLCCFAVGLLIYSGAQAQTQHGFNASKLLCHRTLVGIGLISYSLYLWHWVVLSIMRYVYMDYDLPVGAIICAVIATFVLSVLSYKLVESPARHIKNFTDKKFTLSMAAYFALLAPIAAYLFTTKPTQFENEFDLAVSSKICADDIHKTDCAVGFKTGRPSEIIVIGDSHAAHFEEFFDKVGQHEKWSADIVSSNSCAAVFNFRLPADDRRAERCNEYTDHIANRVKDYPNVFIAGRWFLHYDKPDYLQYFEQTLQTLLKDGKKVYVFADTPMSPQIPLRRYYLKQRLGLDVDYVSERKKAEVKRSAEADKLIEDIVKKYPEVKWVDVSAYIPEDKTINGLPIYRDNDHLNPYGSRKLAEMYIRDRQTLLQ